MKATIFALISLVAGAGLGSWLTQREFAHENVPAVTPVGRATGVGTEEGSAKRPVAGKIGPVAVVVNGEHHNFGSMDRYAHNSHVFQIRNDGDAPLTLVKGTTTCKCTVSELDLDNLPPGKTAEVKLEWDAKTSDAEFEQSAQINTNDPRRPIINLTVHGHVTDVIRPDRFDITFNDLSAKESATASVNIYAFRTDNLRIEKHELDNPELAKFATVSFAPLSTGELAREPTAKSGVKMTVELKSGMPFGEFNAQVAVTTDQNAESPMQIRLVGNVSTDVILSGPKTISDKLLVNLGTLTRAEPTKHTVYVRVKGPHKDTTEVQIAKTEPAAEFSASVGTPNRENAKITLFPLTIEIPANATPVSRAADGAYALIHLTTTHPEVKELTIKVRYIIKE